MNDLKPYLVDVPVKVSIWIREECQRKQFEILKEARPSIMFLISDGGRNEKEWEAINKSRKMFDNEIDWECTVYKVYEDQNNGLYSVGRKANELIWSKVDRCIFLEDDYIPSVCYFKYCQELLERYKDDTRITAIAGMNHLGVSENVSSDYFFSKIGSIWGLATWKRSHQARVNAMEYRNDEYSKRLLIESAKNDKYMRDRIIGYGKGDIYEGHIAGGEFYHSLNVYGQHQLFIIPKYNMISNIGCTENGAHADAYNLMPRAIRKIFNMKTYELEFPLKHPNYIVPDEDYFKAEKKILAHNYPVRAFFRRIERAFLILKYKGFKGIFKASKKKAKRKNKIEK